MISIFACPRAFVGETKTNQRNAIKSWTLLRPRPQIILVGDDEGTGEVCQEFDLDHIPNVDRNDFGTPLVASIFQQARDAAIHRLICYVNADIILLGEFMRAIETLVHWRRFFVMVGTRTDIDSMGELDFSADWEGDVRKLAHQTGSQRTDKWIDYLLLQQELFFEIPPFAIGRAYWDNWLLWRAEQSGAPIVDASGVVTAIHQRHGYEHIAGYARNAEPSEEFDAQRNLEEALHLEEAERNRELLGDERRLYGIHHAAYLLGPAGTVVRARDEPYRRIRQKERWMRFLDWTRPARRTAPGRILTQVINGARNVWNANGDRRAKRTKSHST